MISGDSTAGSIFRTPPLIAQRTWQFLQYTPPSRTSRRSSLKICSSREEALQFRHCIVSSNSFFISENFLSWGQIFAHRNSIRKPASPRLSLFAPKSQDASPRDRRVRRPAPPSADLLPRNRHRHRGANGK